MGLKLFRHALVFLGLGWCVHCFVCTMTEPAVRELAGEAKTKESTGGAAQERTGNCAVSASCGPIHK